MQDARCEPSVAGRRDAAGEGGKVGLAERIRDRPQNSQDRRTLPTCATRAQGSQMSRRNQDRQDEFDQIIRETLKRSRERQGLPPTITDEGILAAVQALLDHAGDE